MDLCAQFFNAGSDIRRADAQGICLSCRVNISKNYRIRCGVYSGKAPSPRQFH